LLATKNMREADKRQCCRRFGRATPIKDAHLDVFMSGDTFAALCGQLVSDVLTLQERHNNMDSMR
jgi:hypothetical protein